MIEGTKTFEIKNEHLELLKRAFVIWEYYNYGAPAIDCKRPYGNSDVEGNIAEIFGWEYDEEEGLNKEQSAKARTLHEETKTALQIALATQKFESGVYLKYEKYDDRKWRKVD